MQSRGISCSTSGEKPNDARYRLQTSPYRPGRAGQFRVIDKDKVGGMITGRIKVIVNEDEENTGEEPCSSQRDARPSTSQSHSSERVFRKATHKSENGSSRESKRIKERTKKEEQQLKELTKDCADLELEAVMSQQTSENQEEDKPENSFDEESDGPEEDQNDADLASESSCEEPLGEPVSRSQYQSPIQDVSGSSVTAHTKAKPEQTFDLQLQLEKRETGGGMTLRQREKEKDQFQGTASAK